jgi:hypothetical protein
MMTSGTQLSTASKHHSYQKYDSISNSYESEGSFWSIVVEKRHCSPGEDQLSKLTEKEHNPTHSSSHIRRHISQKQRHRSDLLNNRSKSHHNDHQNQKPGVWHFHIPQKHYGPQPPIQKPNRYQKLSTYPVRKASEYRHTANQNENNAG